MLSRCYNSHEAGFKNYGGRGIAVCERWHSFKNFLADMGERPAGKTLDRFPNNDGDYEPGNCRWATPKEQKANQRPPSRPYKVAEDLTGRRFGKMTALEFSHRGNARVSYWKFRCDCGKEKVASGRDVKRGAIVSCGCHRDALAAQRFRALRAEANAVRP